MPYLPFARGYPPVASFLRRLVAIRPQEVKLTVGLDLGSASIKCVALGARKGAGPRPIIGHSLVSLDAGEAGGAADAMRKAVSAAGVPAREVNLAVSGQWVIIRVLEMPHMGRFELQQALPFEAQRYLPFNLQDVMIDGVMLGPSDTNNKMWVLIVACKKELIERRMDWAKEAGMGIALLDVDALALANAFMVSAAAGAHNTCALLNLGSQLTNLVIFQGQTPYLVRDIPWGAEKLMRNAADQLGVELEAARKALDHAEPSTEVLGTLRICTETLVTELQLSFDYFENRFGQPPEKVLVSGGLGQCGSVIKVLSNQLTQPVASWSPVEELSGQYAVAYGLALRAD